MNEITLENPALEPVPPALLAPQPPAEAAPETEKKERKPRAPGRRRGEAKLVAAVEKRVMARLEPALRDLIQTIAAHIAAVAREQLVDELEARARG
jgi:hypothetical protein